MTKVYEKLGSWVLPIVLEDIGLEDTIQYGSYEDETHNELSPCQKWEMTI